MTNIMRHPLRMLVVLALAVGALVVALGAVTNAGGTYTVHQSWKQDLGSGLTGVTVDRNNGPVVRLGNIMLAATGTNTKTLVDWAGNPCGNASMNYTTHSDGTYTSTQRSTWNSQGTGQATQCYYDINSNGQPDTTRIWGPSGLTNYWTSLPPGTTRIATGDSRGTATSKTQWSTMVDIDSNLRYACAYLSPGSAGYWALSICSV